MLKLENQEQNFFNEISQHKNKMDTIFLTINSLTDHKVSEFCNKCGNYIAPSIMNILTFEHIYCYCSNKELTGTYADKFNKYEAIFENYFNNNCRSLNLANKNVAEFKEKYKKERCFDI